MIATVLALFKGRSLWVWIAVGVAALAVLGYVGWLHWSIAGLERDVAKREATIEQQRADLEIARANLQIAQATNAQNLKVLALIQADAERERQALKESLAAAEARKARTIVIRKEVERVAAQNPDECELGPSMRAVLDGLRNRPRSADRGPDRAGARDPAAGPPDVRR
jgi:hypothetical protein